MSDDSYLICGTRNVLAEMMMPLVDVECCECGAALVMDARNESAAREYKKICQPCALKGTAAEHIEGSLIGGVKYVNIDAALFAIARDLGAVRRFG